MRIDLGKDDKELTLWYHEDTKRIVMVNSKPHLIGSFFLYKSIDEVLPKLLTAGWRNI